MLRVAVAVVVLLETIGVDDHERQRCTQRTRLVPLAVQDAVEHAAVGDAGERVAVRQGLQLLLQLQDLVLGPFAFADVEHEAHEAVHGAVGAPDHVHDVAVAQPMRHGIACVDSSRVRYTPASSPVPECVVMSFLPLKNTLVPQCLAFGSVPMRRAVD
jgi:hypothetical protein